jgi:hypothetical protein
MTSPYNRLVKTPAEKKAQQQSDTFAAFRQALEKPADATLDESDLIKMEFQEGPVGVGTQGYIPPGTSAGTVRTLDGSGTRVSAEGFREALTPEQHDQFLMPFAVDKQAPDLFTPFSMEPPEQETPWYAKGNLPHIPGLSQAGGWAKEKIGGPIMYGMDVLGEYTPTVTGGIRSGVEEIFGEEAADFYGKWYAGGIIPGVDDDTGLTNTILEDINRELKSGTLDPKTFAGVFTEISKRMQKVHSERPIAEQIGLGLLTSPDMVIPYGAVFKLATKIAKLGKGGKAAADLLQQAENVRNLDDPNSLFYRHLADNLEEGQKQIIVVSNAYPQGRRITVKSDAWQDADNAIDIAMRGEADGGYKILPGDASRAEVIKASGALVPDVSRVLPAPQARAMGARAMEVVRAGRGDIVPRLIANDVAAFVSKEISAAEKAEFLSSYRNMMPTEVSYLDEAGELIPVTRKVTPNPRGVRVPPKLQKAGPLVKAVKAPAGFDDAFGNNQLYNIVDGDSAGQEVVAQILIGSTGPTITKRFGMEGAEVKGFWPTVEGGGPGMFSTAGIQSIVRQLGDHHPSLENLTFAGNLDVRPRLGTQEFVGTATEAEARLLSESDIATGFAHSIDEAFPRMSSLDAARMNFDEYPYAGLNINRLDVDGMPKTVDDLLTDAQAITSSGPEALAAVIANTGPRVPGQPLFSMTDDISSYSYLYAARGALGQIARIPGARRVAGLWNRAQTLAPDDQIGKLGVDIDVYKSVEHARVRTQVMAWWAKAQKELGFKEIRSRQDAVMNRQGVWRAEGVVGYDAAKVTPGNLAHGTIDDILKDSSRAVEDRVYTLTTEQRKYIDDALEMMEDSFRKNDAIGVDVERIVEDYWHRILVRGPSDKSDTFFTSAWKALTNRAPKGAAARKTYQKERMFDDFEDALKADFVYDTNPATRLTARLSAGVETYANQSGVNRLLGMKKADGTAAFLTPQAARWLDVRRLGTENLDVLEEGLKGARERLRVTQAAKILAKKAYKDNDTVENYDTYRKALAENTEAYAAWAKVSKLKKPAYFQAYLAGHITDIALRDEIFKKVYIPQVQNARNLANQSGPNLGNIGTKAQDVFQLFRALMTNVDLAAMGIQGQVLAFRDFRSWTTAVSESIRAIARDPDTYVANNKAIMEEGQQLGAIMRPTEFMFSNTSLGSYPTRIPLFGPAFKGFQRSFEWFIIIGQTEFYKTLRTRVVKGPRTGGEFVPIATDEARDAMVGYGRTIRNLMGTEDYAVLGIRPTQQTIEASTAFAARFMRANIGLIGAAMRPSLDTQSLAAKQAMMHILAGGIAMTNAIHYQQTGRPANMTDPFAPDWMQFTMPGKRIGVSSQKTYFNTFGPLYTYFRTIARVTNIMVDTQDTEKALTEIKNFLASRAGLPIRAMQLGGAEVFGTGARTFEGEAIDWDSPENVFRSVGLVLSEFAVPIGVSGIAEAIGDERWEGTVTEVFGLTGRASPYAQMDIMFQRLISDPNNPMHMLRLEEGRETTGAYRDASPSEKEWMEEQFGDLHERMVQGARGPYGDAGREWAELETKAMVGEDGNGGMIGLGKKMYQPVQNWATPEQIQSGDARPVDGAEYRRQLNDIMNERWIAHQAVADTYDLFQDERDIPTDEYERALYDYRELFKANTDQSTQRINWNLLDEALEDFEAGLSSEIKKYIHNNTGLNRDKTARDLFDDKKILREYWDKKDEIAATMPPEFQDVHKQWRAMSDMEREKFVNTPQVNTAMEYINRQTKIWLIDMYVAGDPRAEDFETKLVKWGYETTPETPAGQKLQRELLRKLGTEDQMKLPFERTVPDMPGQPAASPAVDDSGVSTPRWMQQVGSGR